MKDEQSSSVHFGPMDRQWSHSFGTMAEFSAASTSRSCATTNQRFGKKEPSWPRLGLVICAMPKYFVEKAASRFHCWWTNGGRLIGRRVYGMARCCIFFGRTTQSRGKGRRRRDINSDASAKIRFNWAEALSSGREISIYIFTLARHLVTTLRRKLCWKPFREWLGFPALSLLQINAASPLKRFTTASFGEIHPQPACYNSPFSRFVKFDQVRPEPDPREYPRRF